MESGKKAIKPRSATAQDALPPGGEVVAAPAVAQVARTVSAVHEGFRRAGRAWCQAPTLVLPGELSDAQWAAIEADPLLTVADVEPGGA